MGCGNSTQTSDSNNNEKHITRKKNARTVARTTGNANSVPGKKERDTLPELKQEPTIEDIDVPKTLPGYPVIREPTDKKEAIFRANKMKKVDERARQTPPEKEDNYEDLLAYLTEECTSDVEKVRAVFIWMANQSINMADYSSVTDSDTPKGFMKLMQAHRASYASFFAILCRHAGIPCAVIDGYAKSAGYKVGDPEEKVQLLDNSWNAVYVAGGWRLVFPLWACSAVVGHNTGAYTKLEVKGKAVREKEVVKLGNTINHFNEYYFFTDPEEFVFVAWPKDKRWQLLTRPWNFQKFVDVPYCRQSFFKEGVEIKSKFSSRLKSKEGTCHVDISCRKLTDMGFEYALYYNHEESGREMSASLQLDNYVMLNRSHWNWDFGIRFPEIGVYKLQIVGGRGCEAHLCSFKIAVAEVEDDCKPYPYNPGKIGYGPSMDTELAGIKAVSHTSGFVKVYPRKEIMFSFNLTRDVDVKSELVHNTISKEELAQYVVQTKKFGNVSVLVSVPENGEFALTMHAQQKNESVSKNVCNYLLASDNGRKKRLRTWENPIEKRTRSRIQYMSKSHGIRDIDELEQQLSKFEKFHMDDKGDLSAGHDALDLKRMKKELDDAIKRRHLETLEKAIESGKTSRFQDKVSKQLTEAEAVRDHLKHLNKIAHDVLEMKQTTISELRSYKYPPDIIVDIMSATFLMLGEHKTCVEDWGDLQILMGKLGKHSMLRRVKQFDTINVQPDTTNDVECALNEHTETDSRLASAGAGTFYVWLRDVTVAMGANNNKPVTKQ